LNPFFFGGIGLEINPPETGDCGEKQKQAADSDFTVLHG
jgi:hypothetical protein